MKLDRNLNKDGKGKYALILCRKIKGLKREVINKKEFFLVPVDAVDFGNEGKENEFFVIRLKDRFALPALEAYAEAAVEFDKEYAEEIFKLAARSGHLSAFCKDPD